MGAATHIHVHNNTTQTYEFAAGVGKARLDFKPGWSRVQAAAVDRITGGFDRNGKAKGGRAAPYFNKPIEVEPGKFRPVLHVGRPAPGETVHEVKELPGIRSHYRMTRVREQEETIKDLQRQIAELAGKLDAKGSKATASETESTSVDLTGLELDEIKAAIKGLDVAALKLALGAEVSGEDRAPVVKLLKSAIKRKSK